LVPNVILVETYPLEQDAKLFDYLVIVIKAEILFADAHCEYNLLQAHSLDTNGELLDESESLRVELVFLSIKHKAILNHHNSCISHPNRFHDPFDKLAFSRSVHKVIDALLSLDLGVVDGLGLVGFSFASVIVQQIAVRKFMVAIDFFDFIDPTFILCWVHLVEQIARHSGLSRLRRSENHHIKAA